MQKRTTIIIEDYIYEFYGKIGENAGGLSAERVMADALLKYAGELTKTASVELLRNAPHN